MTNLTPTQAALLRRGLDHLLAHPDHVLKSDLHRVVWILAQMATRSIASQSQPDWPDEDTLVEFANLCQQYPNEARRTLWEKATPLPRDALQITSDLAMTAEPPPEYLTLAEASRLYHIPPSTLRYHAARGSFEAHKVGKTWLAQAHDLAVWVSER